MVRGVDLTRSLTDAEVAELRLALLEHQVLFFRDQEMSLDDLSALGRAFGPLYSHPRTPSPPGHPELVVLHADENTKAVAGATWHSDGCCEEEPPMGSILHLTTVPETGGDTLFASMYAAYDALSGAMQRMLSGLLAVNGSINARWYDEGKSRGEQPAGAHPIVRTHPETGRPALFVNSTFSKRIVGMTVEEGQALLGFLFRHLERAEFQVRFQWRPNSAAFWDNRCTQHRVLFDYHPQVRTGARVTVAGDRPFYRPTASAQDASPPAS